MKGYKYDTALVSVKCDESDRVELEPKETKLIPHG